MVTLTNTSKMVSVTRTALSGTLQGYTDLQRSQEQPHTKQGNGNGTADKTGSSEFWFIQTRQAASLTWHRGCCLKWQICCRSPCGTRTGWGLHSPCTLLSCTGGRPARTRPAAGWCWGSSAGTWSWSPSGNHSLGNRKHLWIPNCSFVWGLHKWCVPSSE